MDQINVGGQQSEEIGGGNGQRQGAQSRIWHSGNCGETGHNACQIVVETSGEEDLYSSN